MECPSSNSFSGFHKCDMFFFEELSVSIGPEVAKEWVRSKSPDTAINHESRGSSSRIRHFSSFQSFFSNEFSESSEASPASPSSYPGPQSPYRQSTRSLSRTSQKENRAEAGGVAAAPTAVASGKQRGVLREEDMCLLYTDSAYLVLDREDAAPSLLKRSPALPSDLPADPRCSSSQSRPAVAHPKKSLSR